MHQPESLLLIADQAPMLAALGDTLSQAVNVIIFLLAFSFVVFVHELGHFVMAKWAGVRVEKFAVGFGPELVGFTRGGTRYCLNLLPLGGYVKMLGQEDFAIDKEGEWRVKDDPDAFTNKPVGARALVVSAGVIMNIVFAAFAFMIVYWIGIRAIAPVAGFVMPDMPADLAGIQPGDRIVRVNNMKIREFLDLKMATVLAEPHEPMEIEIERHGRRIVRQIVPVPSPDTGELAIGMTPGMETEVAAVARSTHVPGREPLRPGDVIVEVAGHPIERTDFPVVLAHLLEARGEPVPLVVERPDPDDPSRTTRLTVYARAPFSLLPAVPNDPGSKTILGLVPRLQVAAVMPGSAAEEAGFEPGDVILRWGAHDNPTVEEVRRSVEGSVGRPIAVTVLRRGQTVSLTVTPRMAGGLLRESRPLVGLTWADAEEPYEDWEPQGLTIAAIVPELLGRPTPAAALAHPETLPDGTTAPPVPRGTAIVAIDGRTIRSWQRAFEHFRARATESARNGLDAATVALTLRYPDGGTFQRRLIVPVSVTTALDIPESAIITSIAGESSAFVRTPDGQVHEASVANWRGAWEVLRQHIGETVEVRWTSLIDGQTHSGRFRITEETADPWAMRGSYRGVLLAITTYPLTETIRAGNPLEAVWIGIRQTGYIILQVYMTMQRMIFTRTVGVEHVSGPVGIIDMGRKAVEAGPVTLLWLLAVLSANLAVINFLPLPIVDGGLMVFLIIEKIKGSPLSLKTQAVTQIIGLALIVAAFLFVTIMDIYKITGG